MPTDKPGKTPPKKPAVPRPFKRFEDLTRRVLTAGKPKPSTGKKPRPKRA